MADDVALEVVREYFDRMNANVRALEAGEGGRRAQPSRGAARVRAAGLSPAADEAGADDLLGFYRSLREQTAQPRGRDSRHRRQRADVARTSATASIAAADGGERTPQRPDVPAALRLRAGQPPELLPLVEHARRGVAGARRGRRTAPARRARRAGAADAAGRRASAAWRPSSPATGSTSAASRSTTPSIASGSRRSLTNCAQAMFEEPIRFFVDLVQRNGSVLDFLYGDYTFVNAVAREALRHAATPTAAATTGCASTTRGKYERGGLLPMAVFLTKNAPGLRTSPVKRGYWVVRRVARRAHPAAAAERARCCRPTRRSSAT